jgi:eukaryotic-like serine/threonine-protein kinase
MRADGATPERVLVPPDPDPRANTWALDWGRDFVVARLNRQQPPAPELWALPLSGDRKPFPYLPPHSVSDALGPGGALSPNGRWLAYGTSDRGVEQVIVQSFPDATQFRHQISRKSGLYPRWSRSGRELFYIDSAQKLVAVSVLTDGPFKVEQTTELFTAPSPLYDVAPRGERFLFNVSSTALANPPPINLVLNWTTGLK